MAVVFGLNWLGLPYGMGVVHSGVGSEGVAFESLYPIS